MKSRAVVISQSGGPEVLTISERTVAEPGPGQVRIAVRASALNRADVLQRRGLYPAPAGCPADIPGLEYAGTVADVGAGVTRVSIGDRVMGIIGGGGMAEHVVVHEGEVMPAPAALSLEQAAAIPEAFLTAYDALVLQGGLRIGQSALIHAAASGVGTAAILLCRALGALPIGTVRSADKLERLRALGLEQALVVGDKTFAAPVLELTGKRGADVILDMAGASYLQENLKAVAIGGRIVVIGLMGGASGELNLGGLLARRVTLIGSVLRSRSLEEKALLAQHGRSLVPLFDRGILRPVVDEILPMERIQEAHRRMEENQTFGKLVLAW